MDTNLNPTLELWQSRARAERGDFVEGVASKLACDRMKSFADHLMEIDEPEVLDGTYDRSQEEARKSSKNGALRIGASRYLIGKIGQA